MNATPEATASTAPSAKKGMSQGIALAMTASLSNQAGAAIGALAFSSIGPMGVVVIRQFVTALVMLPLGRPKIARMTWSQWWPVICLGLVLGAMNMAVYTTIDRLGLGLAMTLEFLGPLAIAILASRRLIDVLCGVLAGVGVVVLVNPSPSTDYIGVAIGLISAIGWASYVLLNRKIGQRLPGFEGSAAASLVSVVIWIPIALFWFMAHPPALFPVILAVLCALLSSVVPLSIDMLALRRLSPGLFSTLASMHPVWAAIVGLVVLQQMLTMQEWLGIALVVVSNVLVTATNLRRA